MVVWPPDLANLVRPHAVGHVRLVVEHQQARAHQTLRRQPGSLFFIMAGRLPLPPAASSARPHSRLPVAGPSHQQPAWRQSASMAAAVLTQISVSVRSK